MYHYFLLIFSLITLYSCTNDLKSGYDYGTESDSARYYFFKGWSEIMDYGRWTESEIAFRKAVEFHLLFERSKRSDSHIEAG